MNKGNVNERPRLLVQKGNKTVLLDRDSKNYYLIDVDRNLTWETEEWLIRHGVSKEKLDNLALKYRMIPKTEVRGIALSGTKAGDALYVYLRSGKREWYLFSDAYLDAQIDVFFEGVERFLAPAERGTDRLKGKRQDNTKDSWKNAQRDPELYEKFRYVSPSLTALSILGSVGYIILDSRWCYLLCLLCMGLAVALDIVYPAYFTLIAPGKGEKSDAWELYWPIMIHVMSLLFLPQRNWMDKNLFFTVAAICAVASVTILGLFAEEFRRRKMVMCLVSLLVGLLGTFVVGHFNEVFDFNQPKSYTLVVKDLERSGRKNRTYECTVTLPGGREVDLNITRSLYDELEIGDLVRVEHGIGALGIEYANAYPLDQDLVE